MREGVASPEAVASPSDAVGAGDDELQPEACALGEEEEDTLADAEGCGEELSLLSGETDADAAGVGEAVGSALGESASEAAAAPEAVAPPIDTLGAADEELLLEANALGEYEADALEDSEGGGVALALGSADKDAEGREEALSLSKDENEAVGSDDRETVG